MTTLPDRIRAAALGPTPRHEWQMICGWMPCLTLQWKSVHDMHNSAECGPHDTYDIRMFLLFVACALENP